MHAEIEPSQARSKQVWRPILKNNAGKLYRDHLQNYQHLVRMKNNERLFTCLRTLCNLTMFTVLSQNLKLYILLRLSFSML